jgi:hypothetical protein
MGKNVGDRRACLTEISLSAVGKYQSHHRLRNRIDPVSAARYQAGIPAIPSRADNSTVIGRSESRTTADIHMEGDEFCHIERPQNN